MVVKLFLLIFLVKSTINSDTTEDLFIKEIEDYNTENNYLVYNRKSNSSDFKTTEVLSLLNYNETYQQLLSKITSRCVLKEEYKELFKDKSTFILSSIFFPFLVDGTIKEIGLNELRKGFHLKTQEINYKGNEEFEDENRNDTFGGLIYFQNRQKVLPIFMFTQIFYRKEDVPATIKFIDKKFPEVRKLFQLKYQEKNIYNLTFNNKTVRELYLNYMDMRAKITKADSNN
uniref:Uncharacterized protein n=1 Tax=Meloidogyne enterolobii TaxID=390850 RepID=A0A6V7WVM0_MELEN|nr:unnamed protein product [Meloidogyne enterolobii]